MQPKTKIQKQVAEAALSLPKITEKQTSYAYTKYFKKYAVLSRRSLYCLECGNVWRESGQTKVCLCPECGNKLDLYQRYNVQLLDNYYYSVITTHKDMQVIRLFYVNKYMRKKQKAIYSLFEVMQQWIDEKGKTVSRTISKSSYGWNGVQWNSWSPMEVRPTSFNKTTLFGLDADITYPRESILPVIKRNGFNGLYHGVKPQLFFPAILSTNHAETLLKTGQIKAFTHYIYYRKDIDLYWNSVRICIRNNYIIPDISNWLDYVRLLEIFGKDILNRKYICPVDLKSEHDRYVDKKRALDKKKKMEEQRAKAIEDQRLYLEKQNRFTGLRFEENGITIRFLETVEDFMREGDALNHCVFTNEYYLKENSLILSARIENKPIETIEVSLKPLKLVQARGNHNVTTEHHAQIVDMVTRNMNLIRKRLKQKLVV